MSAVVVADRPVAPRRATPWDIGAGAVMAPAGVCALDARGRLVAMMKRTTSVALLLPLAALSPAAAQDANPLVVEGRNAFLRNGCHDCHTVGRVGTSLAPDLSRLGATYGPAYLLQWLRDPSSVRPSAHMPALELTDADIRALAAYLAAQQ
ncbi:MAG TPA: c-type cytochrome [Methylomirabilota bacterium]|jgi:mono/diheme cytochrome c family protein|nr:c-type cytochrome [Methylomirabilota bacterium]